jgi:hypothetical protein
LVDLVQKWLKQSFAPINLSDNCGMILCKFSQWKWSTITRRKSIRWCTICVKEDFTGTQSLLNPYELKSHPWTNLLKSDCTFVRSTINSTNITGQSHCCCFIICFTFWSIANPYISQVKKIRKQRKIHWIWYDHLLHVLTSQPPINNNANIGIPPIPPIQT